VKNTTNLEDDPPFWNHDRHEIICITPMQYFSGGGMK
jgi:hypothetical protein